MTILETRNERIARLTEERMNSIEEQDFDQDYHRSEYGSLKALRTFVTKQPLSYTTSEIAVSLIADEDERISWDTPQRDTNNRWW